MTVCRWFCDSNLPGTCPLNPFISVGMLAIAEQILSSSGNAETRRHLRDLLSGPSSP